MAAKKQTINGVEFIETDENEVALIGLRGRIPPGGRAEAAETSMSGLEWQKIKSAVRQHLKETNACGPEFSEPKDGPDPGGLRKYKYNGGVDVFEDEKEMIALIRYAYGDRTKAITGAEFLKIEDAVRRRQNEAGASETIFTSPFLCGLPKYRCDNGIVVIGVAGEERGTVAAIRYGKDGAYIQGRRFFIMQKGVDRFMGENAADPNGAPRRNYSDIGVAVTASGRQIVRVEHDHRHLDGANFTRIEEGLRQYSKMGRMRAVSYVDTAGTPVR